LGILSYNLLMGLRRKNAKENDGEEMTRSDPPEGEPFEIQRLLEERKRV